MWHVAGAAAGELRQQQQTCRRHNDIYCSCAAFYRLLSISESPPSSSSSSSSLFIVFRWQISDCRFNWQWGGDQTFVIHVLISVSCVSLYLPSPTPSRPAQVLAPWGHRLCLGAIVKRFSVISLRCHAHPTDWCLPQTCRSIQKTSGRRRFGSGAWSFIVHLCDYFTI